MHSPLFAVALGVAVLFLAGLFSRRSTWPVDETIAAAVMTVVAFVIRQLVKRDPFLWEFHPLFLFVALPLGFVATVLWVYVIGRTIRGVWLAWR